MKKEQLTALGVPEDKIQGILDLVKEETKDMIPKFRFDELTTAKNSLTEQLKTANSEIEKLKKFEGTNTELQTKINDIQKDLQQKENEYKEGLQKLAKGNLIKLSLMSLENRPYDVDIVAGLIDSTKVFLDDKSEKIVSGLTEQVEAIRKEKAFLFSTGAGNPNPKGNPPPDGNGNPPPNAEKDAMDFGKRLAQTKLKSMGIVVKQEGGK